MYISLKPGIRALFCLGVSFYVTFIVPRGYPYSCYWGTIHINRYIDEFFVNERDYCWQKLFRIASHHLMFNVESVARVQCSSFFFPYAFTTFVLAFLC